MKKYVTKKSLRPKIRRITYSMLEKKYADNAAFNLEDGGSTLTTPISTTAYRFYSLVNNIRLGTGVNQRIGNKIFVRYLHLTFGFKTDGDNVLNGSTCRYGVIWNKQANGTLATGADVFSGGAYESTPEFTSLKNFNTMKKYKTLLDRAHLIIPATRSGDGTGAAHFNFVGQGVIQHYIPINKWVQYSADAAGLASSANLVSNDFLVYIAASNANCCIATLFARICFNDA